MTQYSGKIIRKNPVVPTQQAASGVWTTADAAVAVRNNTWPVAGVPDPISRSLRFRASATGYLNRTPAVAGSRTTWTFSAWVKRGQLSNYMWILSGYISAGTVDGLRFQSDNTIDWIYNGGRILATTQVFRDPSAWYHLVFTWDTTQATSSNRAKIYVNGVQITAFSTASYPAQNSTSGINNATVQRIGVTSDTINSEVFDGYLTEINFIDGQALTPSSFGTTDALTGAWIPMAYTGTYGANGFYLNFKDNTSTTTLGYDYSGNANNWATNNISLTAGATYDSMLDVPTPWVGYSATTDTNAVTRGNYCTLNPVGIEYGGSYSGTFSNANLSFATSGNASHGFCTMAVPSTSTTGFYFEAVCTSMDVSRTYIGLIDPLASPSVSSNGAAYAFPYKAILDRVGYYYSYSSGTGGGSTGPYTSYAQGDVVMVAYKNGVIWFGKNGTWMNSGNPAAGTGYIDNTIDTTKNWLPYVGYNSGFTINFGQQPFSYTPPTGFKTLCTTNLPDPTIKLGAQYMAATTYTGTGAALSVLNSANNTTATTFQPDFVWAKRRNSAASHALVDSVRGTAKTLFSDSTAVEDTTSQTVTAFNSNGFTVGNTGYAGANGDTYIGWQWKAAGSTVSNTAGSITSTVNAGTTQGFSVVTYTGNGTNGATVGHGLGVTPSMVIVKSRSATTSWFVAHTSLTTNFNLLLQTSDMAYGTSGFGSGVVGNLSSTVFTCVAGVSAPSNVANINTNGATYVAYCFAAVAGYSAFGSYTGNGSADGVFVYLGFRPRWLMFKRSSSGAGTANWVVIDTSRDTYNLSGQSLEPNLSDAEYTPASSGYPLDILSNGFKQRGSAVSQNESGSTYIYAAFAENPFKYSNAR